MNGGEVLTATMKGRRWGARVGSAVSIGAGVGRGLHGGEELTETMAGWVGGGTRGWCRPYRGRGGVMGEGQKCRCS